MNWLLLDSGPGESAFNMALDQVLLEAMPELGRPVLRFYGWTEPAASFGYFQCYADVQKWTPLRPLVRRPTGGGIVPHDRDWTYCLAFPSDHSWYALRAKESYRRVHLWIQAALARLGVSAELAPAALKSAPGQCFRGYEESDLLWRGRKIAGAAQRRTRQGLLIQGSVQPPIPLLVRDDWQKAMGEVARPLEQIDWSELAILPLLHQRAQCLARNKYALASFVRKR
jgi:lipoyl(octanoyl) transferase